VLSATGDACGLAEYVPGMNEDWLAVIVGLALLALVLVGALPGSVIP
jgi:Mg/Co/Ni transporter MgtE